MPDSSETGETGGKSATRSSRHFSFQSSDLLTRPAFLACLASLAGQEPVGQEYFFAGRFCGSMEFVEGGGLFLRQAIFFFSKYSREPHNRDEGLDLAGAMDQTATFCRDTHRSTDEGAVVVEATVAICF